MYNIGFEKVVTYWKDFLKKDGILAVSEISWTTETRPRELEDFWVKEYPEIDTVPHKIEVLERPGYKVLGHFILPESCWFDNYYNPFIASHEEFLRKFGGMESVRLLLEEDNKEVEFYNRYKEYYSYGFYVARKV